MYKTRKCHLFTSTVGSSQYIMIWLISSSVERTQCNDKDKDSVNVIKIAFGSNNKLRISLTFYTSERRKHSSIEVHTYDISHTTNDDNKSVNTIVPDRGPTYLYVSVGGKILFMYGFLHNVFLYVFGVCVLCVFMYSICSCNSLLKIMSLDSLYTKYTK